MTERIYIDMEKSFFQNKMKAVFIVVIGNDGKSSEIIYTGKTYLTMPVSDRIEKTYQILSNDYDINFIFDDDIPQFTFYPVPRFDIFATDSMGGCIGSTKNSVSIIEEVAPIYYISQTKQPYYIAPNLKEFMRLLVFCTDWRKGIDPSYHRTGVVSEHSKEYLIDIFQRKRAVRKKEETPPSFILFYFNI